MRTFSSVSPHMLGAVQFLVPYQFIAKVHTEGLGRAPRQEEWVACEELLVDRGCTVGTVAEIVNRILRSDEFEAIGYSDEALVEVAYRTILNREPEQAGYDSVFGKSMSEIVEMLVATPEFSGLVATMSQLVDYKFGTFPHIELGADSSLGFVGTQAELQLALDAAGRSRGTISLAPRALIRLTSTLAIPEGVTLTTTGAPSPNAYAEMGRLVREPGWIGPSVLVGGSAHLRNVWVEGNRLRESVYERLRFNLEIRPGMGTSVEFCRIGNTAGATSMQVSGSREGVSTEGTMIAHNLIESYTANHDNYNEADGISGGCCDMTVEHNTVIDASDVGIILFGAPGVVQLSKVRNNVVIQAGHGAHALLSLDGSTKTFPRTEAPVSFEGAELSHNLIWTSPAAISTLGISLGTFALFGDGTLGRGGVVTHNSAGKLNVVAQSGIAISGHLDVTVQENSLNWIPGDDPTSSCPMHEVGVSLTAGYAGGGDVQAFEEATYSGCWGRSPHGYNVNLEQSS